MLAGLHAWVRIHFYCIWTFKAAYSYRLVVLSIYSSPQLVLVCSLNFYMSMLERWYRCSGHQEDVQDCGSWKARHTHPDDSWPMTMGPFTTKSAILPFCTIGEEGSALQKITPIRCTSHAQTAHTILHAHGSFSLYICHVPILGLCQFWDCEQRWCLLRLLPIKTFCNVVCMDHRWILCTAKDSV